MIRIITSLSYKAELFKILVNIYKKQFDGDMFILNLIQRLIIHIGYYDDQIILNLGQYIKIAIYRENNQIQEENKPNNKKILIMNSLLQLVIVVKSQTLQPQILNNLNEMINTIFNQSFQNKSSFLLQAEHEKIDLNIIEEMEGLKNQFWYRKLTRLTYNITQVSLLFFIIFIHFNTESS